MNVETILATAITIIGLAGGAAGYFGKSRGDSIIKYQANEISLRDGTITRLEKDNSALLAENTLLKSHNEKLWSRAQGSPQLKTVNKTVGALSKAVNTLSDIVKEKLEVKK